MSQSHTMPMFFTSATPRPAAPRADAVSLWQRLRHSIARRAGAWRSETAIDRLNAHMLRDVGLVPNEPPHALAWDRGMMGYRP